MKAPPEQSLAGLSLCRISLPDPSFLACITEHAKLGTQHAIILSNTAAKILADQRTMLKRKGLVCPWVFPSREGGFAQQHDLCKYWKRLCAFHNIKEACTPHEIRHTFVSTMEDMPVGLKKMAMGHSKNMDTEGVYGHAKAGDMERAAAYIDATFDRILK